MAFLCTKKKSNLLYHIRAAAKYAIPPTAFYVLPNRLHAVNGDAVIGRKENTANSQLAYGFGEN